MSQDSEVSELSQELAMSPSSERSPGAGDSPTTADLWSSRCLGLSSASVASEAGAKFLPELMDVAQAGPLGGPLGRRLAVFGTTVFTACVSEGRYGQAEVATDALVAVLLAAESREGIFQVFLETLERDFGKLALEASARHGLAEAAQSIAAMLLRVLAATSKPSQGAGAPELWMPQIFEEVRNCCRLAAVRLLQSALDADLDRRALVEAIAVEVAAAATRPGRPSAAMLLKSLSGAFGLVLRSRFSSAERRCMAVQVMGKVAAKLAYMVSDFQEDYNAELCSKCEELPCEEEGRDAMEVSVEESSQKVLKCTDVLEAAPKGTPCPKCLGAWVALQLEEHLGLKFEKAAASTILAIYNSFQAMEHDRHLALLASQRSLSDAVLASHLVLCSWAADIQTSPKKDQAAHWTVLAAAHKWLSSWPNSGHRLPHEAGSLRAKHLWRKQEQDLLEATTSVRRNIERAALLQLRSPRPLLRAAALRALAASAGAGKDAVPVPLPHLCRMLTSDDSAKVREVAVRLAELVMLRAGLEKPPPQLLGVLQLVAMTDASPAVKAAAQRLLGQVLGRWPQLCEESEICAQLIQQGSTGRGSWIGPASLVENLRLLIFGGEPGDKAKRLLHLFSTAHYQGFGSSGFLRTMIKAHSNAVGLDRSQKDLNRIGSVLVNAFLTEPTMANVCALLCLSATAPRSLAEQLLKLSHILHCSEDEAVVAGLCRVFEDVVVSGCRLQAYHAWGRFLELAKSCNLRLVRAAMRVLAVGAKPRVMQKFLLQPLIPALVILQEEAEDPLAPWDLIHAAWVASTAVEFARDLDAFGPLSLLKVGSEPWGVAITKSLLKIFLGLHEKGDYELLPTLIPAIGFALRREVGLLPSAEAVFTVALRAKEGREFLVEKALEALAGLVKKLTDQADEEAANGVLKEVAEDLSGLAKHHGAVIQLMQHGLLRRPTPSAQKLRARAIDAASELQRAGLVGQCSEAATSAMAALFGDRALSHRAAALLAALARQDSIALAAAFGCHGVRLGFAALLWQAPELPTCSSSCALQQSFSCLAKVFGSCCRCCRSAREKVLQGLLQELRGAPGAEALPPVPPQEPSVAGGSPCPTEESDEGELLLRDVGEQAMAKWSQRQRSVYLYAIFVAKLLVTLPLRACPDGSDGGEVGLVRKACTAYLELKVAAATSSLESGSEDQESLFAVAAVATACCALVEALRAAQAKPLARLKLLEALLVERLPLMARAAEGEPGEALESAEASLDRPEATSRRGRPPQASRMERVKRRKLDLANSPQSA